MTAAKRMVNEPFESSSECLGNDTRCVNQDGRTDTVVYHKGDDECSLSGKEFCRDEK